jgi:hypothetical protein
MFSASRAKMRASLVIGAGPGGTGPLLWAAQHGYLAQWLDDGVTLIERGRSIGGTIGRYIINSDSLGAAYLECLDAPPARALLEPLRTAAATHELERMRSGFPPLQLVGEYLDGLGECLEEALAQSENSEFLSGAEVRALHLRPDTSVAAAVSLAHGGTAWVEARTAIMALGGRQIVHDDRDAIELMPAVRLADIDPKKLLLSDTLFTRAGLTRATAMLERSSCPQVVILGGRHSAFSAAWLLLTQCGERFFAPRQITMLCRQVAPIFYATRAEAEADGCDVTARDICPRTQRVNRFSGMRGDGRQLWRRIARRPGVTEERRVAIIRLSDPDLTPTALRRLLDNATLIVPAFGYRAATIPVFDCDGRRLALRADQGGPAVGCDARLLLATGGSITNIFGIGLGTGFQPWGEMGGEADLKSQTNSLWLYQNHIGGLVYRGVQECLNAGNAGRAQGHRHDNRAPA